MSVKIKKSVKLTVELESGPEKVNFSISPVGETGLLIESDVPKIVIDHKLLFELIMEANVFRNAHMKDQETEKEKQLGEIANMYPRHE